MCTQRFAALCVDVVKQDNKCFGNPPAFFFSLYAMVLKIPEDSFFEVFQKVSHSAGCFELSALMKL